jgi:hypothetical protein
MRYEVRGQKLPGAVGAAMALALPLSLQVVHTSHPKWLHTDCWKRSRPVTAAAQ